MESWTSTWAHLTRTGPDALLLLGTGAIILVGGVIVGDALAYGHRVIRKLLTRD